MRTKLPQLRQALTGYFDDHAVICAEGAAVPVGAA
jgi:hypothetical protein